MPHEPKLTVYTISLNKADRTPYNTNRWLFRNIIQQANTTPLADSFIMAEVFRKFINLLDTPEMYSDTISKKCMTANQLDIGDDAVNANIILHSEQFIIEGRIEGGSYGRKRNKTSTVNKTDRTAVQERDAITEDFYFLLYSPLNSSKSVLMLHSYSDDTIDSVMKKFWQNFFSLSGVYKKPSIRKFFPKSIVNDFKNGATVSSLSFVTDIPGQTLLQDTVTQSTRHYEIKVQITPLGDDLTMDEYEQIIEPIKQSFFSRIKLGQFSKKKGSLRDRATNKTSPFELGSSYEIEPTIMLAKYIDIYGDDGDFGRIRTYCFSLLEDVKKEIFPINAIQER